MSSLVVDSTGHKRNAHYRRQEKRLERGHWRETAQVDLSMRKLLGETCLERWKHIAGSISDLMG